MKGILFLAVVLAASSGVAEDTTVITTQSEPGAACGNNEKGISEKCNETIEEIRTEGREKFNEAMDMLGDLVKKTRELKGEPLEATVIPLQHASPSDMAALLDVFDAQIEPKEEFNAISVKATPEDLATIEQLVKRFDLPMETPNVELEFYVLTAHEELPGSAQPLPEQLHPVIEQILKIYPQYKVMRSCTFGVRARDGNDFSLNDGGHGISVKFDGIVKTSGSTIKLDLFSFKGSSGGPLLPLISTSIGFEEGQYIVIGKSNLMLMPGPGQEGSVPVFLVVTGQIVK